MKGRPHRAGLLCLALAGGPLPAPAGDLHPLEDIRSQIAQYLEREVAAPGVSYRLTVADLDPRLRLSQCGEPLQLSAPGGSNRSASVTIQVRCPAPRPWSIYVPARASALGPVVVLARPVAIGAPLGEADLRLEERELHGLGGGHFSDPGPLVGKTLRRAIAPGQPLVPAALANPAMVRRGERVVLVARAGGLDVRMPGEALRDAAAGESVSVRNLSSDRVVVGRVVGSGTVEVPM